MELNEVTEKTIGAAIAVHRELGPGFLESVYEEALCVALAEAGLRFKRQVTISIRFHGIAVGEHRLDLLVEDLVVVELKAVVDFDDIHFIVLRSYLKATDKTVGLLLNFASAVLDVRHVGREWLSRNQQPPAR